MARHRESVVVRIDCEPPCLIYEGYGPLPMEADDVIPSPETALGAGELIQVPDIEGLINGTTGRYEYTLSGVSQEALRLAIEDAPSVANARVDVGVIKYADDWSIDSVEWHATLEARALKVSRPMEQGGTVTRSVSLTVAHGETRRSRPQNAHYTDQDQRRRSSDDAIFSHVGGISAGTTRRFGPE